MLLFSVAVPSVLHSRPRSIVVRSMTDSPISTRAQFSERPIDEVTPHVSLSCECPSKEDQYYLELTNWLCVTCQRFSVTGLPSFHIWFAAQWNCFMCGLLIAALVERLGPFDENIQLCPTITRSYQIKCLLYVCWGLYSMAFQEHVSSLVSIIDTWTTPKSRSRQRLTAIAMSWFRTSSTCTTYKVVRRNWIHRQYKR